MLQDEDTPVGAIENAVDPDAASGPQSLMEQLRAQRQEVAEAKDTLIPLPGYEPMGLQAKYRLMDRPEVEKIGKNVRKRTKDRGEFQMMVLVAVIANACEGFYIRQGGQTVPLKWDDDQGRHVTRWEELAKFCGASDDQVSTAANAIYFMFGGNEFAIGNHGITLNRWFGNTGAEVDADFLGEAV